MIILGSVNDDEGNLSGIAKERLDQGIKEYKTCPGFKILLTGGYGKHFNRTGKPHAFYAKRYLLEKGIKEENILGFAESFDTVEDAFLSKLIVKKYKVKNLMMITSDFHIKRVRYIFEKVFENYNLIFSPSKTNVSKEKLDSLKEHEIKSLNRLKREGINPKTL